MDNMTVDERDRRYADGHMDTDIHILAPRLEAVLVKHANAEPGDQLIDEAFGEVIECVKVVLEGLPKTKFLKKPFWNEELRALKRGKVEAYRIWVGLGRPRDPDDISHMQYRSTKRVFMRRFRQLSKEFENTGLLRAVRLAEMDPNAFWRVVEKARGHHLRK